jgi:hypothetical protein
MPYLEIPAARFNKILDRLSDPEMVYLTSFDLLILSREGQSAPFYDELRDNQDFEVLWTGWLGPAWTSFLSFVTGHAGLVKILKPEKLRPLFEKLSETGVADIYYVPKTLTALLTEKISSRKGTFSDLLEWEPEYVHLSAQQDDIVQEGIDCYFLYEYHFGPETAAVLRTVFTGLK